MGLWEATILAAQFRQLGSNQYMKTRGVNPAAPVLSNLTAVEFRLPTRVGRSHPSHLWRVCRKGSEPAAPIRMSRQQALGSRYRRWKTTKLVFPDTARPAMSCCWTTRDGSSTPPPIAGLQPALLQTTPRKEAQWHGLGNHLFVWGGVRWEESYLGLLDTGWILQPDR